MASLDMVGFVTGDIGAALAFYRLLGLEIPEGVESEGHVEVITPNGYRLAWDTEEVVKSFVPDWQGGSGKIAIAFKCDTTAEVDSLYKKVVDAGYHGEKEPWDAFWGQRYAVVKDPDGNPIDIFCPL